MKVVVTGFGACCALGENTKSLWNAIEQGHSGIAPINRFNVAPFDTRLGAMVPAGDRCDTEAQRLLAYGCAAATETLQRAKVIDRGRVALVLGTCNGLLGKEVHIVSTDLAHALNLGGPAITFSTACASSAHALGFAADLVRRGVAEFALAGGVDALCLRVFAGFHSLGLLAKTPCAPFSTSMGTTLGEGAAFMLLESARCAQARAAAPLAEFMGYGLSADAFHDTTPDPSGSGMARALEDALEDAGLAPETIDYVNAHGTGTATNDAAEWRAIQRVFGDFADRLPVSSSKSFLGHTQGAAGALEAVVTLMAMARNVVPPTINLTKPRPNAPTDPVAAPKPRSHITRHAICANAAFGGVNAAFVLGPADGVPQPRREAPPPHWPRWYGLSSGLPPSLPVCATRRVARDRRVRASSRQRGRQRPDGCRTPAADAGLRGNRSLRRPDSRFPRKRYRLWQEHSRTRSNAPFSTGLYTHGLQLRDWGLL